MQKYEFYPTLDMSEYMENSTTKSPDCAYSLLSIMVHMGTRSNSGHYIAYIKPGDRQWYKFNDEVISKVSEKYVFDMSYGNQYEKKTLDPQSKLDLTLAFKPKVTSAYMSSQAYMLVYVKTASLKENMKAIDPVLEVDKFIRDKVDLENLENRRVEYWQKYQLFYIVLPEMLRGHEMRGLLINHVGVNDDKRVTRFVTDPRLRQAMIFNRSITVAEWLNDLSGQLGIALNRFILGRYDVARCVLNIMLTKKLLKDTGDKRLSTIFRPGNSHADTPIIFIHIIDQTDQLTAAGDDYRITDNILNGDPESKYVNCHILNGHAMVEESDVYDHVQEDMRLSELSILFVKSYTTSVLFQETRIVSKKIEISELKTLFAGKTVFFECTDRGRAPEIFNIDRFEGDALADISKSAFLCIVVAADDMVPQVIDHYDNLSHQVFVKLVAENLAFGSTIEMFDDRTTVPRLLDVVHREYLHSIEDRDMICLKYSENTNSEKIIYNDESFESMTVHDLVACR